MAMICFDSGDARFNYRVAGIALRDNQVLLNRLDSHWFLPGGRVEMGETSGEALQREMREEIQEDVQVGRLLWIAESFFDGVEQKCYHELGLYYLMTLAPDASIACTTEPLATLDGSTFQWFSLTELDTITLYPPFLVEGLRKLPEQTVHILDGR
ncbi:MAG: NUDIX hydrolase [Ktedonobacteraceae bacterium]